MPSAELLSLVKNDDKVEATITASICEVYNEQVYDLLSNKRVPRKLKQRGVRDCVADGIIERKVCRASPVLVSQCLGNVLLSCDPA